MASFFLFVLHKYQTPQLDLQMSYYSSENLKNPGILKYLTKYLARQETIYFSNSGTYKKMVGAQIIFDLNVVQIIIMLLNL